MKNLGKYLCYGVLAVMLVIGTLHIFRGDLFYETDISRDMLLLEDMIATRKISLIGGRSSIPGVFHGPFYYWLVLPVFALSGGDPVAVSYVWLVLYWLFLGSFYYVGRKVFDQKFALLSTTLMASLTAMLPAGFTHTVLANFLIIPFIYLLYRYIQSNRIGWLFGTVLLAGLLIQFQMAFGGPVLILAGGYTIYHIIKNKHYSHLWAGLVILIPLSTYLAFDWRHDFIQTKSVLSYVMNGNEAVDGQSSYALARLTSIIDCFKIWNVEPPIVWQAGSGLVIGGLLFLGSKIGWGKLAVKGRTKEKTFILLALLIIFGFWIITLPFQGTVWSQYYRPLWPLIVFCLTYCCLYIVPGQKIGIAVMAILIGSNALVMLQTGIDYWQANETADEFHWRFYRKMTSDIFADAEGKEFGYYVFSPDQYGYQAKYALHYFAAKERALAVPYQKRAKTYLVIAPNGGDNPWADENYWQKNQVKIEREADGGWTYSLPPEVMSYSVRKFDLSDQELAVPADSVLIDGIHFR